jgi:transmembrane sensor
LKEHELDLIERYVKGTANEKEIAWVESLLITGENELYLKHIIEKDWDLMLKDASPSEVKLNHLLDQIHHTVRKNETIKRQKPVQKIIRFYMKAAAVLFIPIVITVGLIYSISGRSHIAKEDGLANYSIYAPLGSRVSFMLPDSTKGMLNSGSSLSYSLPFSDNRKIKIVGEGWFEVKHDKNHPFLISTCNSLIKVLGTTFNLSSYPEENYVEVVLQQGKVEFQGKENNEKTTILPKERMIFRNGYITKSATDPAKYEAWTQGKLVFRGDLMAEVARRIERWYNVKVVLADKELEKYSFRATFEDDKIEEVLRFLSMTSPITYRITPRKLLADGTFEKEEITIFLKK